MSTEYKTELQELLVVRQLFVKRRWSVPRSETVVTTLPSNDCLVNHKFVGPSLVDVFDDFHTGDDLTTSLE